MKFEVEETKYGKWFRELSEREPLAAKLISVLWESHRDAKELAEHEGCYEYGDMVDEIVREIERSI